MRRSRRCLGWLSLPMLLVGALSASGQEPMNRDYSGFTRLREQGYPLRTAPSPKDAAEVPLEDGDLVLGVVVGEEARAYPIGFFWSPQHEILNDTLGGTPIAPSW